MKKIASVITLCFFLSALSFADDLADTLVKQGIGARAAGMGGAYSAVANDASAVFYNPAGLAEPGIGYTYGSMDQSQQNNDFTYSLIKLGYIGYSESSIMNPNGDHISMTAFGFGSRYGWLNWGTNYKSLEWTLGGTTASGWTADFGLLMRVTPQLKLAVVAQDILTTKDRIVPASGRVGFSYKPFNGQLILAGDVELYHSLMTYGHLGAEANLMPGFSLRGGIDRNRPTAGISLDLSLFSLEYAVLFPPDGHNIQRYEAGFKFSPQRERPFSFFKPKEFALVDIGGDIKSGQSDISLFGGYHPGLDSILESIRNAGKDSAIDGIFLRIRGFSGGLGGAAMVQEMRAELQRVKSKGKKIVAYVEGSAVGDEYYLASVADKIVAAPGSAVGGFGRSIELYRVSGLLNQFGVTYEVMYKGKYKNSFDWLSPKMNDEKREMTEGIVADIYRQVLRDISVSRNIKIEKVKEIGDGMIFPAYTARAMGLIDNVGYFRDAGGVAAQVCGSSEEVKIIEASKLEPEENFFGQAFGVAVIEVDDEIVSGGSGRNVVFGGNYTGSDKVVKDIRTAADDMLVKAIILRIDSPGGSSVAAGEIYNAIKYAKEKKKIVIASLGSIAASGGYYIAAGADKIVADSSTITGSIGVIGYFPNYAGLFKKLGIDSDVIKEGAHADMFSGLRGMTTIESQALDRILDEAYQEFIRTVAEGRKMPTAEVEKIAQGRIYTGTQALDAKLIDRLGGFLDAVDLAKKESGISGDARLIYYREINPLLQVGGGVSSALGLPPLKPIDSIGGLLQYN